MAVMREAVTLICVTSGLLLSAAWSAFLGYQVIRLIQFAF
jgi:hypothetical protein